MSLSRALAAHASPRVSKRAITDRYLLIRRFFHNQNSFPALETRTQSHLTCSLSQSPSRFYSHKPHQPHNLPPKEPEQPLVPPTPPPPPRPSFDNYSHFFRGLAQSVPHGRTPTREDFLNAASGFWQRLRVRAKWLFIRSFRRFNADDMSAFITWFIFSQAVWIFVGTWVRISCLSFICLTVFKDYFFFCRLRNTE